MYLRNTAGQTVAVQILTSEGVAVTTGTTLVYYCGDNGTRAACAGNATLKGDGMWAYSPTAAEINFKHVAYQFVNAAGMPVTVNVRTADDMITLVKAYTLALVQNIARSDVASHADMGGTYVPTTMSLQGIRSRADALLLAASYTAPDNASIAAIYTKTGAGAASPTIPAQLSTIQTQTDKLVYLTEGAGANLKWTTVAMSNGPTDWTAAERGQVRSALGVNASSLPVTSPSGGAWQVAYDAAAHLATAMELDGSVYRFTTNSLENAPVDWTAAERGQIRSALGVSASGNPVTAPAGGSWSILFSNASTAATQATTAATQATTAATQSTTAATQATTAASKATAIDLVTAKLDTMLVVDGVVYQFTANGLELGPGGAGSGTDWTADERAQIRSALGVDGTKSTAVNGQLQFVNTVAGYISTAMELDGAVYRFTTNSLELAPSGSGSGTADWTVDEKEQIRSALGVNRGTMTIPAAGGQLQAMKLCTDRITVTPAGVGAQMDLVNAPNSTAVGVIQAGLATSTVLGQVKSRTDLIPDAPAAVGSQMDLVNAPNATAITALQSGLATESTVEGHVVAALGTYTAPTMDQFSSRTISSSSYATASILSSVKAKTDLIPSSPAAVGSKMDLVNAPNSTAVGVIQAGLATSTALGQVKARTDLIPDAPAAVGSQMDLVNAPNATAITALQSGLATSTTAGQIKAKTDNLPADPASNTQVGTRLASSAYVAPDNANILVAASEATAAASMAETILVGTAAVKAKTDNLPADPASNTQVGTRLASSAYVAPDNADILLIKAQTDKLGGMITGGIQFTSTALANAPVPFSVAELRQIRSALGLNANAGLMSTPSGGWWDSLNAIVTKLTDMLSVGGSTYQFNTFALANGALDWTAAERGQIRSALGVSASGNPVTAPAGGSWSILFSNASTAATQATTAATQATTAATQSTTAATQATTAASKATAIDLVTAKLDTMLVVDGVVYQFTANGLELGPGWPASSAQASIAAVQAALNLISAKTTLITGAGQVTLISPVSLDGQQLTLIAGDDYTVASEQPLIWEDSDDAWPSWIDEEGAATTLTIRSRLGGESLAVVSGLVITGGTHLQLRFELPRVKSILLTVGLKSDAFDILATSPTHQERTIVRGYVDTRERQSA